MITAFECLTARLDENIEKEEISRNANTGQSLEAFGGLSVNQRQPAIEGHANKVRARSLVRGQGQRHCWWLN